ncbi:MAG: hypothetical protein BMS9Abin02_0949 [Anaerolineae bacterium]|nr:MAG: hypothetical protein BMS9Abin02_0949 [Anaerolineae bacterium]
MMIVIGDGNKIGESAEKSSRKNNLEKGCYIDVI